MYTCVCTGDGIVKKKGGNVDSRCGEKTRWLKVGGERERKKKKTPPSWRYRTRSLLALLYNERERGGGMEERFLNVTPLCVVRD